jgi:hypothetical protein
MLDLDTEEGKVACQCFLDCLKGLLVVLGGKPLSRVHRIGFTLSYRRMFSERVFLADILDSA